MIEQLVNTALGKSGCNYAGNRSGIIGAKHDKSAVQIAHLVHLLLRQSASRLKNVVVFDSGSHYLTKALRGIKLGKRGGKLAVYLCLTEKYVPRSERDISVFIYVNHLDLYPFKYLYQKKLS